MIKNRCLLCVAAMVLLACPAHADDDASFGIFLGPDVSIPVGSKAYAYSVGFGGQLSGMMALGSLPWLSPLVDVSYEYIPINAGPTSALSVVRAAAGARATMLFGERLTLYGQAAVGGYVGMPVNLEAPTAANIGFHAGLGAGFQLLNDISLNASVEYAVCRGTYDSVSIYLGVGARLSGPGSGAVPFREVAPLRPDNTPLTGFVEMSDLVLMPVYPVLRKYYDSHPIGHVMIANVGDTEIEDVEVRLRPAAFIDSPKLSARLSTLPPGSRQLVDLYVLFNEAILGVTEDDKIVTDVEVTYRTGGRSGSDVETVTLDTYNRNAMSWDADEKIAAFVTSRDEEIQRFARLVASVAQDAALDAINSELQLGMLMHCAMIEQGVAYAVDPLSSYEDLSDDPLAVDYVQFPRQTLYVGAGDCDDLSATFCALMQAAGVSSAFITVPGHIFTAFQLHMRATEVRGTFTDPGDFIFRDDTVWVPVETTILTDGFLAAWSAAAQEWAIHSAEGTARFFTVADAWETYDAVAFGVSQIELSLPDEEAIQARFADELDTFIGREVVPREESLLARLRSRPRDARLRNSLGVLYARYGMLDEAEAQFEIAVEATDYVPAMVNLANVWFISGQYRQAEQMYRRALEIDGDNPTALLGLARCEYELGDFGSAQATHHQLEAVEPSLAADYPYLGSPEADQPTARSSGYMSRTPAVIWEDE
jgi:tetratricopeptide (TPR) repeat protein